MVNTTIDEMNSDGDCSLREAVVAANHDQLVDACPAGSGADIIVVPAGVYQLTIADGLDVSGETGDLDLVDDVTITGAGQGNTVIDADHIDRIFEIAGSAVTIQRLTIKNGQVDGEDNHGGGIRNEGNLTLRYVTIRDNASEERGGGIYNSEYAERLRVDHATIIRNTGGAGGIDSRDTETSFESVTITNSVIADNEGSGILTNGRASVRNTAIRDNAESGLDIIGGPVWIAGSTISGNHGSEGGGIRISVASSKLIVINSTISGNTAAGDGGGIRNGGLHSVPGTVILRNSTITGNTANGDGFSYSTGGGGLHGPFSLSNTIVAGNIDLADDAPDCSGTLTSQRFNLIGDTTGCTMTGSTVGNRLNLDPLLGPLADNGWPTMTHALLDGSPAIDRGNPKTPGGFGWGCPVKDQRGTLRPQDGDGVGANRCDIGAYEKQAIGS